MSSNLYDKTTHKLIPIAGNSESTAASLGSLSDVVITSPTNGQHLTFDLATSQWKNADASLPTIEVNDLSDVTIISVSNGQILKWNSTTTKWENSSFNDITSLGAIPNVDISQVQDGDILVYDTTSGKWINTALDMSDYQTKNLSSSIAGASTVEGALGAEETAIENEISTRATLGAHNIFDNKLITQTVSNVVYTVNSDKSVSLTVNSELSSNAGAILGYIDVKAGERYTLSGGINAIVRVDLRNSDYSMWVDNIESKEVTSPSQSYSVDAFTPSNDATLMVYLRIDSSVQTGNVGTVYPMIRLTTDTDSTYEPYSMTNQQITPYIQSISNPNLLDNPWFTVNQRGFTTSSTPALQYFADRWYVAYNVSSAVVTHNADDSITLDNTPQLASGVLFLGQRFEGDYLCGKQATVSVLLSNGRIITGTGVFTTKGANLTRFIIGRSDFGVYSEYPNAETLRLIIEVYKNQSITVKAVKIELGSVSTLAMDTVPNYQQELAKCQRYFTRFSWSSGYPDIAWGVETATNQFWGFITTPVPMRTKPSVSSNGLQAYKPALETAVSITAVAVGSYTSNKLKLLFTESANGVVGTMAEVQLADDAVGEAYIAFSADL